MRMNKNKLSQHVRIIFANVVLQMLQHVFFNRASWAGSGIC